MKKMLSVFITFLFVFNFVPNIFSSQNGDIDINSFDEFSINQVQKVFSNTLSQEQKSDKKDTTDSFLTLNNIDCNLNVSIFKKIILSKPFFTIENIYNFNYLYKYKLFEFDSSGAIPKYRMNFNSYIAVVLFDTNNVVDYFI